MHATYWSSLDNPKRAQFKNAGSEMVSAPWGSQVYSTESLTYSKIHTQTTLGGVSCPSVIADRNRITTSEIRKTKDHCRL